MVMSAKILVCHATGGLGRKVLKSLVDLKTPTNQIVAMVRDPTKLATIAMINAAGKGISLRRGDYLDYNSCATCFEGIKTVLVIASSSVGLLGDQHDNAITAAQECRVKHIIYTSLFNCDKSKFIVATDHLKTEHDLKRTSIPYTIVRPTLYADIIPLAISDALTSGRGRWHYPVGTAKVNFVTKADVAEALAIILLNPEKHENKTYEITGPKSYTFSEIAGIVGKAVGKEISYSTTSMEEFKLYKKGLGLRDLDVDFFASSAESMATGEYDVHDPTLEKLIGRKPKTLEEYLPRLFAKAK